MAVVTFGSPVVGDAAWAANFDAKINARKLAFKGDLVVQVRPRGSRPPEASGPNT